MTIYLWILYGITLLIFLSGLCLLNSTNTIYTLLYFLLLVVLVSGLLVMLGTELFAIFYLLIYVGVIMILFMFTFMLVNLRFESLKMRSSKHLIVVMTFFHVWLSVIFTEAGWKYYAYLENATIISKEDLNRPWVDELVSQLDIEAIGVIMYSKFGFFCVVMGLIFLVVLVGCLTLIDMLKQHEKAKLVAEARLKEIKTERNSKRQPPFIV